MERPEREKFPSLEEYKEARAKYVEWALGAGGRLGQQLAALAEQQAAMAARLKALEQPAAPVPSTIEDEIRQHAHHLIVTRYSGSDQFNITRKATRLGASKKEYLELEVMDEWIEAVRKACADHLLELAAMPEDARAGYNWLQDWPKEA